MSSSQFLDLSFELKPLSIAYLGRIDVTLRERNNDNGVGLSEKIFAGHRDILRAALGLLENCACSRGCPACIGPFRGAGAGKGRGGGGKNLARAVLEGLLR